MIPVCLPSGMKSTPGPIELQGRGTWDALHGTERRGSHTEAEELLGAADQSALSDNLELKSRGASPGSHRWIQVFQMFRPVRGIWSRSKHCVVVTLVSRRAARSFTLTSISIAVLRNLYWTDPRAASVHTEGRQRQC